MLLSLLLSLLLASSCGSAQELLGLPEINPSTFDATIAQGNTLVFMANPICPRCKKIVPEIAQLKEAFPEGSGVNLVALNCAQNSFFCHNTHRVGGYPGIKYFTKDGPELGTFYEGEKSYGAMRNMIVSELGGTASGSAPLDPDVAKSFFKDMNSKAQDEPKKAAADDGECGSDGGAKSSGSGKRGLDYNGVAIPNQVIFVVAVLVVGSVWAIINKIVATQREREAKIVEKQLKQAQKKKEKALKRGNSKKKNSRK